MFSAGSQQTESPAAEPALQVHGVGISRCAVFLLSIPGGLAAKCRAGMDRPAATQAEANDTEDLTGTRGRPLPTLLTIVDLRRSAALAAQAPLGLPLLSGPPL